MNTDQYSRCEVRHSLVLHDRVVDYMTLSEMQNRSNLKI